MTEKENNTRNEVDKRLVNSIIFHDIITLNDSTRKEAEKNLQN